MQKNRGNTEKKKKQTRWLHVYCVLKLLKIIRVNILILIYSCRIWSDLPITWLRVDQWQRQSLGYLILRSLSYDCTILAKNEKCHYLSISMKWQTLRLCLFPDTLIALNFLTVLCVALHFPESDIWPWCYLLDFTEFVGNEASAQLDQILGLGISSCTSLVRGILALLRRCFVQRIGELHPERDLLNINLFFFLELATLLRCYHFFIFLVF